VQLSISIDPKWPADPGRRLPVYVDPKLPMSIDGTDAVNNFDTYVDSGTGSGNYKFQPYLGVGATAPAQSEEECCQDPSIRVTSNPQ